jgi:hypothetical protein
MLSARERTGGPLFRWQQRTEGAADADGEARAFRARLRPCLI